ncbi:MAG: GNAT family N-acetyltransferase, partial [Gammaproteobacteria bacterium]|nr:GNAT family N-acetyltransferase [Gammaproteobacteria bacterium]
ARGRGFGRRVVQELERVALHHKIEHLVLLTQTASEFFRHEGYRTIERAAAPTALQESAEFRSLCPSSATCMAKILAGN